MGGQRNDMGFFAKTTLQILCLSAVSAALEEESPMESFVRRIRESDDYEDDDEGSDFVGDIVLDDESERDLDLIFAQSVRGGRKKDKSKKMAKQKVKKTKHILRLVSS